MMRFTLFVGWGLGTARALATLPLSVHDGVFSRGQCEHLEEFLCCGGIGERSTVWDRRLGARSPIEAALGSYLSQVRCALGDYVEYWSRNEHVHVEFHRDLDEAGFDRSGLERSPAAAHVLYLKLGASVRGPTCVLSPPLGDAGQAGTPASKKKTTAVVLTVVPAVVGRVLRFDGDGLHGVPRPATRWLEKGAERARPARALKIEIGF